MFCKTAPSGAHPTLPALGRIDWCAIASAYLFFWYFSGITHVLLMATDATGFFPLRQGIVFSLLWLIPMALLGRHGRIFAGIVGLVLWLLSLLSLGYFMVYRQEFSQSALFVLFESNPAEATEYLGHYFSWTIVAALLLHSAVAWWLWRHVRPLRLSVPHAKLFALVIALLLFVPPTIKVARHKTLLSEAWAEAITSRMEPALPWQYAFSFAKYSDELAQVEALQEMNRRIPPVAGLVDANAGHPATVVLVIGESTNRQHMSLYGYGRETTPRLAAMREQLTVFGNVVASRPYTIETLQQALTFADQENPNLHLTRPSLMNIMKQAGYKTFWITNQQTLTKRNTMLTNFAEQTDEQVYLNHSRSQNSYQFDGNVLDPFARILGDPAERKFIVVHLLGAHMRYEYRYPPEFELFKDRQGLPDWVTDEQQATINHYDNAVRYNDHVVASLIERLQGRGGESMMLYFADHGEDVFDSGDHHFVGRNEGRPSTAMYTVPFLLWQSAAWKQAHPRDLQATVDRPYQTSHLIHTWADLVGLSFEDHDPSKSVVNPKFAERPLWIGDPSSPKGLIDLRTMLPEAGKLTRTTAGRD